MRRIADIACSVAVVFTLLVLGLGIWSAWNLGSGGPVDSSDSQRQLVSTDASQPSGRLRVPESTLLRHSSHDYDLARERTTPRVVRSPPTATNVVSGAELESFSGRRPSLLNRFVAPKATSPHIDPKSVAGKTPGEIDALARQKGLVPKGPDPAAGRGAYTDPVTGKQRVLCHPSACPPHAHVNNPAGERLDINGNVVPPESPEAHLPLGGK